MPLVQTRGAASAQGFGEFAQASAVPNYIEDVFNSYLWTTSGSNQTLTTGIDMTKGALTWIKGRSNAYPHILQTGIGGGVLPNNALSSNSTAAYAGGNYRIADSTTGFTMGTDYYTGTPQTAVVWTFRKQPKFFDIVTYTGNGVFGREISHNLGALPAVIIIKATSISKDWLVYTTAVDGSQDYLFLNTTAAKADSSITTPWTSTTFPVGGSDFDNGNGVTYVAYLFASNAGGFGLTGSDNVISCGSYTGNGSATGPTVNLGYEPQWVLIKEASASGNQWVLFDNMRGMPVGSNDNYLFPNLASAESSAYNLIEPTATGFYPYNTLGIVNASGQTYIYIAIRRGPMKVPTSGTNVFSVESYNQTSASDPAFNLGKVADAGLRRVRDFENSWRFQSRLTGNGGLITSSTDAESTMNYGMWDNNVGWYQGASITPPYSQANWYGWTFARAPSFFDEVCYTGNNTAPMNVPHNLGVTPQLMIIKKRSGSENWNVFNTVISDAYGGTGRLFLNNTNAYSSTGWAAPIATSTAITLDTGYFNNESGSTYVAYLFATCAGVSKVGSYTGNAGYTVTVPCGFTGGVRFVLIKRTDSTGDWYVWDSARGIVAGNDPYLLLNSTAAEVTGTDYIDTYSAGFEVTSTAPAGLNASGGTYIFLAIA